MARRALVLALLALPLLLLVGAKRRAVGVGGVPQLHLQRSFAITDKPILEHFTFARVLDQLVARSGVAGMTSEELFRQWWDTQNPRPGRDATMPHCDDELTDGKPSHNGFPRRCPTLEGALATAPYRPEDFFAIGIVNRFDMADPAGSNCGQYRLIFAKKVGTDEALHVIFEAALANPNPSAGVAGCRPVAQFWANLSAIASLDERRERLERFFFEGIPGFAPALDPDHFHRAPAGIRTLQTAGASATRFYQWRLVTENARLFMKPDVLENLPFGALFDASLDGERGRRFREAFVANVKTLAIADVNRYFMAIPNEFLIVESDPGLGEFEFPFIYNIPFNRSQQSEAGRAFHDAIAAELRAAGSTMVPQQIIFRAETQNCVGCHAIQGAAGDGVVFPGGAGNEQHIAEDVVSGEAGPGTRFRISPAMENVFIPNRMRILREFLVNGKPPERSN